MPQKWCDIVLYIWGWFIFYLNFFFNINCWSITIITVNHQTYLVNSAQLNNGEKNEHNLTINYALTSTKKLLNKLCLNNRYLNRWQFTTKQNNVMEPLCLSLIALQFYTKSNLQKIYMNCKHWTFSTENKHFPNLSNFITIALPRIN
jgi:hypothetical protein